MYHKDDSGDDDQPSEQAGDMYGDPADMYEDGESPADSDGQPSDGDAGDSGDLMPGAGFDSPLVGPEDEEPEREAGTFYVKHVEDVAVTLHEVDTGQIYTIVENPGLERREIIEATLIANPPLQVSYVIDELKNQRTVPVEVSPEQPTTQAENVAGDMESGQAVAIEREGEGEIHVLTVEPDQTEETIEEVTDDEMIYKNAARYGVGRVEIRSDASDGLVSIRYLP